MKFLLISSRFPWPPHTGDRLRATIWLDALRTLGQVVLVSPDGRLPPDYDDVVLSPALVSAKAGLQAALHCIRQRLPFHSLIAALPDWPEAIERAGKEAGEFDCAVVLLSRLDPWLPMQLPARIRILDAIDSLAMNVSERARASSGLHRIFWNAEARRTLAYEKEVSSRYDAVTVVNEAESDLFGPKTTVVPNGVTIRPLVEEERVFDFGFWGRLGYFANRVAADLLLDEVWPLIRAAAPRARLLIAGADAPKGLLTRDGRQGIRVISTVLDLRSLMRRVRIAVFPVQFGTGQSTKVLEAAEAGCAVVGTPQALRALPELAAEAVVERDIAVLAQRAVELFRSDLEVRDMGARLRSSVAHFYSRERSLGGLRTLVKELTS